MVVTALEAKQVLVGAGVAGDDAGLLRRCYVAGLLSTAWQALELEQAVKKEAGERSPVSNTRALSHSHHQHVNCMFSFTAHVRPHALICAV